MSHTHIDTVSSSCHFDSGIPPIYKYNGFIFELHNQYRHLECVEMEDEDIGTYYKHTNELPSGEFFEATQEFSLLPPDDWIKYQVE